MTEKCCELKSVVYSDRKVTNWWSCTWTRNVAACERYRVAREECFRTVFPSSDKMIEAFTNRIKTRTISRINNWVAETIRFDCWKLSWTSIVQFSNQFTYKSKFNQVETQCFLSKRINTCTKIHSRNLFHSTEIHTFWSAKRNPGFKNAF